MTTAAPIAPTPTRNPTNPIARRGMPSVISHHPPAPTNARPRIPITRSAALRARKAPRATTNSSAEPNETNAKARWRRETSRRSSVIAVGNALPPESMPTTTPRIERARLLQNG